MKENENFNEFNDSNEIHNDFEDFDEILIDNDFKNDTEPSKDKKKKKSANKGLTLMMISIAGVLVLSFVLTGLLFGLSSGEDNAILASIGISALNAVNFLKLSLTLVFGLSSLVGLLFFLINLFSYTQIDFLDVEERKLKFKNVIFGGVTFFVSVVLALLIAVFWNTGPIEEVKIEYIGANLESTLNLTAPIDIEFSAKNLPIDTSKAQIVSYNWNFGDGDSGTGQTIFKTFKDKPATGVYEVKLGVSYFEVADKSQAIKTLEFTRLVGIENVEVTADFQMEPKTGFAPLLVEFDASSSVDPDGSIILYEWDFNGDSVVDSEGVKGEFTYESVGLFKPTLIVTDNNGRSSKISKDLIVKTDEVFTPRIKVSPSDDVLTPNRSYQFDASDSLSLEGEITNYKWNFGDGKERVGRKVSYSFENEGIYEVTLELLDDSGNKIQYFENFTVSSSPSGLFPKITSIPEILDGKIEGQIPFKIQLDAGASSGAKIVEYSWDFENDSVLDASGQLVEHVYTVPGKYDLKLTITSTTGKTASKIIEVEVFDSDLRPEVSANPSLGNVPLEVTFDASATKAPAGANIVQFRWNFDDGTPVLRSGSTVTHLFTRTGEFNVEVTAVTDENEIASTDILVFVNEIPLKACYKSSRIEGPAPLTVLFNPNCTTGNVARFEWDFAGLGDSEDRKPSFTFEESGEFEVILRAFDPDNNLSTFKETIKVN